MSEPVQLGIGLHGIGKILSDRRFAVPIYQRSYAWQEEQVRELYTDLNSAITKPEKKYFLGSIVISEQGDARPEVVDGQQRLASITVLLAVIRDYFLEKGDIGRAGVIEEEFLTSRDRRTMELTPHLRLNEVDHNFFVKRILSRSDEVRREEVETTRASHRRISKAAEVAVRHIRSIAETTSDPTERLLEYVDHIENNAQVIAVTVPNEENAFVIFETLNDRGLSLSVSDLLKNYLFRLSGDRIGEAQQRWISMIGALETVGDEEMVVTYIRHLWSSRHGYTRSKELYSEIRQQVNSKQGAIDFASELEQSARLYTALLNPNHDLWARYGATVRSHLSTLHLLRVQQNRPLLLAILKHFPEAEVRKCLRLMVSVSVRFLIVGGLGTGTLESRYSAEALKIRSGEITSASELMSAMADVVPTDEQFESEFSLASVSRSYLARYYLTALEKQARGQSNPEFVPNTNQEQVNLEHVLPENPSEAWDIDLETARAYYKRIGNLTLLRNQVNAEAGNDGFLDKLPCYENSSHELTKQLTSYKTWGPEQINERQRRLSKLAVETWPVR